MIRIIFLLVFGFIGSGRADEMEVRTISDATKIANLEVSSLSSSHRFEVLPSATKEYDFGWSFLYAPDAYVKSRNPNDLVPGNGPLIIERNGKATFLSSSVPPSVSIGEFSIEWHISKNKYHTND